LPLVIFFKSYIRS